MGREPRRLARAPLAVLALAPLLGLQLFLGSGAARELDLGWLWLACYAVSALLLLRRLRRGELLDPALCLVGTYLLLLGLGVVLFEWLRASALTPWTASAIGTGHLALWAGCALGAAGPRPTGMAPQGIASRQGALVLLLVLLVCCGASAALFLRFGGVPLLAQDPDEARLAILAGQGELGLFLVGLGLLPYAFLHDALARGRPAWHAHLLLLAVFLVLLSLGGRARALSHVLGYVGLALLLRPRPLRPLLLGSAGLATLALLAGVGAWRRGGSVGAQEALAELGIGVAALPAMVVRLEQRIDPGELAGGPWNDLATLLPGEDQGANVALKYRVFENWRALPASAGVNPSLVGEGYLYFGAAGVVWWPFLLGLVSALLHRRLGARPSFPAAALYVCWITGMMAAIPAGVGIRLTHFVQQALWVALLALFFLARRPHPTGSKALVTLARVGPPA